MDRKPNQEDINIRRMEAQTVTQMARGQRRTQKDCVFPPQSLFTRRINSPALY